MSVCATVLAGRGDPDETIPSTTMKVERGSRNGQQRSSGVDECVNECVLVCCGWGGVTQELQEWHERRGR